ncbi:DNA cytosine methyltransferase [Acetobacter orientalis]|uniref:Cytosine-specific methyltransferase n=1 Tax=Acetobacter orientalis TaxID=146474 RepID=A0A0D6NG27_9PROT|nr:DNA cytosine methyltransferase [Acetobacter orientalis]GAN65017.1 site-specific DNA-methyltransferase [Acetobacter orientalis]GBR16056.1 site-specific DNA methylase [Acetobacter orientalis NRIC 0481]GEL61663.1 hypothetical protein AOR02nite_15050 [Acetobacter orientalis]
MGINLVSERKMDTIPHLITTKDAAQKIGISEQRVRSLMRSGNLQGQQIGKQWLTTEDAIKVYLKNRTREPVADQICRFPHHSSIKALSFFSGAMGLDLGLENAGIPIRMACEIDKLCRQTIIKNRPDIGLIGNIWEYTAKEIREFSGLSPTEDIDVIVGGPPCQTFSTAGTRRGFHDSRGNALLKYIDLILELKPKFAVIENVRGLLSAPMVHTPHAKRGSNWQPTPEEQSGGALMHILKTLQSAGYGVSFNLYNAANFGVPQSRERVVLICSRDGKKLPYLTPTHSQKGDFGLPKWRTFAEAVKDLDPKNCDHAKFPESRVNFYKLLKPGQYWKHLPKELHRAALGNSLDSGGGKTGFLRRLDWEKPSCTLVTSPIMPATDICHPVENRPLSVQEYARIQQFPDSWIFCGSITDQYRQIGNAVPVGLGEAIGRTILAHIAGQEKRPPANFPFSRYKDTNDTSWAHKMNTNIETQHSTLQKNLFSHEPL